MFNISHQFVSTSSGKCGCFELMKHLSSSSVLLLPEISLNLCRFYFLSCYFPWNIRLPNWNPDGDYSPQLGMTYSLTSLWLWTRSPSFFFQRHLSTASPSFFSPFSSSTIDQRGETDSLAEAEKRSVSRTKKQNRVENRVCAILGTAQSSEGGEMEDEEDEKRNEWWRMEKIDFLKKSGKNVCTFFSCDLCFTLTLPETDHGRAEWQKERPLSSNVEVRAWVTACWSSRNNI